MKALNIYELARNMSGLLKIMALTILLVVTFGCGSDGSSDDDVTCAGDGCEPDCSTETDGCGGEEPIDEEETIEVSGSAVKGIIIGGTVSAYTIVDGFISVTAVATTTTDSEGNYELDVPESDNPLLVTITANANTLMVCDAAEGCGAFANDAASSTETDTDADGEIDFGDIYLLNDSAFELSALLDEVGEENVSVHLTPLTHMAAEYVRQGNGTFDAEAIEEANERVRELFALDTDILTTTPLDITNLSNSDDGDAALYSALIASFSDIASDSEQSISAILASVIASFVANNGELVQNSAATDTIDLSDLFAAAQECLGAAELADDQLDLSEIEGLLATETTLLKNAVEGALTSTTIKTVGDAVTRAKELVTETRPWTQFILDQSTATNSQIVAHYDNAYGLVNMFDDLSLVEGGATNAIADIIKDTVEMALISRDRAGLLNGGGIALPQIQNRSTAALDIDTTMEMDCGSVVESQGDTTSSATGTITVDLADDSLTIDCEIDETSVELTGSFSFEPSMLAATSIVLTIESADISSDNFSLVISAGSVDAKLASAVDVSDSDQSFSGDNLSGLTVDLELTFTGSPDVSSTDSESEASESTEESPVITIDGSIEMDITRDDAMDTSNTTIEGKVSNSSFQSLEGTVVISQIFYVDPEVTQSSTSLYFSGTGAMNSGDFSGQLSMTSNCASEGVIIITQSEMGDCTLYLTSFDAVLEDYDAKTSTVDMALSISTNETAVEVSFSVETEVEGQPKALFELTTNSTEIGSGIGTLKIYYDLANEVIDRDSINLAIDYNSTEEASTAITITNGDGATIEFDVPSASELASIAGTISVDDVEEGSINYDEIEEMFMATFSDTTTDAASE